MKTKQMRLTAAFAAAFVLTAAPAWAWPERRIELIVPFPAGGGFDQTLIPFARLLEEELGQPVVLINRPGANGQLGWEYAAGLEDSSHTMVGFILPHFVNTLLYSDPGYSVDSFVAVAQLAQEENFWFVRKDAAWNDMTELLEDAASRPGEITIAVPGTGGDGYVSTILTEEAADVDFRQVNVQGGGEVLLNVAGGHLDVGVERPGEISSMADEFKILGVLADDRNDDWPDSATFAEQLPDLDIPTFRLVRALSVTNQFRDQDPEAYETLVEAVRTVTLSEAFADEMEKLGVDIRYAGPEELQERIDFEVEFMSEFVDVVEAARSADE